MLLTQPFTSLGATQRRSVRHASNAMRIRVLPTFSATVESHLHLARVRQPALASARLLRRGLSLTRALSDDAVEVAADVKLSKAQSDAKAKDLKAVFVLVGAATLFGLGIGVFKGADSGQEFFAGYLLEQSLSVDNLFVFILMFSYFQVPIELEAKVLNYGIYGAAVLRAGFILAGAELLENFRPVLLLFAGLLVYSSAKMLFTGDEEEEEDLEQNAIVSFTRKLLPVSNAYDGDKFFTQIGGVRTATPLLLTLIVIELSDIVFAVDSIPAVFGVTQDPFIVYTSNMFAILTLRSLFTVVAGAMGELRFLEKAVGFVLGFVGVKMILDFTDVVHISTSVSLGVVAASLAAGVGLSLALPEPEEDK